MWENVLGCGGVWKSVEGGLKKYVKVRGGKDRCGGEEKCFGVWGKIKGGVKKREKVCWGGGEARKSVGSVGEGAAKC